MLHILSETEKLKIIYEYEHAFLLEKSSNKILFEDTFYGEPHCGLIDTDNQWAIIAGDHFSIWKHNEESLYFNYPQWIHSLRMKNSNSVKILTDPWEQDSAIWLFNLNTNKFTKVRDFCEYHEKGYTENVIW